MYSALLLLFVLLVTAEKTSLVWLCLERCPGFDFESDLKMLALHKKAISLVSYENWQIDANGHLQFATHNGVPVSDVGSKIAAAGFSLYPMLTSGATFFFLTSFSCSCVLFIFVFDVGVELLRETGQLPFSALIRQEDALRKSSRSVTALPSFSLRSCLPCARFSFLPSAHNSEAVEQLRDSGSTSRLASFSSIAGDINAMRALFAAPEKLITDAIDVAKRNKYIGYHIDFEPATGAVPGDAVLYATFVDTFSKALHKVLNHALFWIEDSTDDKFRKA